jgi:hypothetical protein
VPRAACAVRTPGSVRQRRVRVHWRTPGPRTGHAAPTHPARTPARCANAGSGCIGAPTVREPVTLRPTPRPHPRLGAPRPDQRASAHARPANRSPPPAGPVGGRERWVPSGDGVEAR